MADLSPLERIAALEAERDQWKDRANRLEAVLRNSAQALSLAAQEPTLDAEMKDALGRTFHSQLIAHDFQIDPGTGAIL